MALEPLLDGSNTIIKEGVAALLDKRRAEFEAVQSAKPRSWTAYQLSEARFLKLSRAGRLSGVQFSSPTSRQRAWSRFRDYAYQWY